jgi:hypothetical protein
VPLIFRIHQGGVQRNSTAAIAHGKGADSHALEKTHFPRDRRTFHDRGMAGVLGEPSQAANDFTMIFHDITAEWCWGYGSVHPGLARKTRSVLNLAVLTCRLGTQVACTRQDPAGMPARLAA